MAPQKTPKPATAETVNGLRKIEQLGGELNYQNSESDRALQVAKLTKRCAISAAMAAILAPFAFGEASR